MVTGAAGLLHGLPALSVADAMQMTMPVSQASVGAGVECAAVGAGNNADGGRGGGAVRGVTDGGERAGARAVASGAAGVGTLDSGAVTAIVAVAWRHPEVALE